MQKVRLLSCWSLTWAHIPFSLAAISVLLGAIWTIAIAWNLPWDGLQWSVNKGTIHLVPENSGPAASVGIQSGDEVMAIDGLLPVNGTPQYYHKHPGDTIVLTIRRGGQISTFAITLTIPPADVRLMRVEPLLVGLFFWLIGLVTWWQRPFNKIRRLFFLLSLVTAAMLFSGNLSSMLVPQAALFFNFFLLLLAPVTLHFYILFPNPLPNRFARPLLRIAYSGAGLFVLARLLLLLVPTEQSPLSFLWLIQGFFVALTLLIALGLLLRPHHKPHSKGLQRRHILIAGMIFSLFPLLTFSFLSQLFLGKPVVSYNWTFLSLILLPVSYFFAVESKGLSLVDRLVNRSLVYFILTLLLLAVYLFFFVSLGQILPEGSWGNPFLGVVVAAFVAAFFSRLRLKVRQVVDRFFYGGWYDYRSVVRVSFATLNQVNNQAQLVEQLLTTARTMRFQAAAFLWPSGKALIVQGSFGLELETVSKWQLPVDGILLSSLATTDHITLLLTSQEVRNSLRKVNLTESERVLLKEPKVKLLLPLVNYSAIRGLLVLGERQGGVGLDREDYDILKTIAGQAALAAGNISLIQSLQGRIIQVEQMRDELAEAQQRLSESREAERLHLARELHDGPVQDLYGASFQLATLSEGDPGEDNKLNATQISTVQAMLQQVSETLRNICSELRPPTLVHFGLEKAIRSHLQHLQASHPELEIEAVLTPDGEKLSEQEKLALFRICQEALNNVVRHARAKSVLVRLVLDREEGGQGKEKKEVILEIQDDGQGFVVPERWILAARQGHLGLLGAAERAEAIGGQLQVLSTPGEGTIVQVVIPRLSHANY